MVTQTVAVFGVRPTANAFGIRVWAIATMRLGEVGLDAEALDHRVQLRRLLRTHLARAHRRERDLVRGEELHGEQRRRDHRDRHGAGARGDQHADQHRVDEAEQEQRHEHPDLEPGVVTK